MRTRLTASDIRAFRQEHGLEVSDLAKLIGVYGGTIRRWESGQGQPTGTTLKVMHILARGTRGERALLTGLLNSYRGVGTRHR